MASARSLMRSARTSSCRVGILTFVVQHLNYVATPIGQAMPQCRATAGLGPTPGRNGRAKTKAGTPLWRNVMTKTPMAGLESGLILPRRSLLKGAAALGLSSVVGAPFINRLSAAEPHPLA